MKDLSEETTMKIEAALSEIETSLRKFAAVLKMPEVVETGVEAKFLFRVKKEEDGKGIKALIKCELNVPNLEDFGA